MFKNKVVEVFLFVNPLGPNCYESEKLVESFSAERNEKVKVRFIPLLNLRSIKNLVNEGHTGTTKDRNELYAASYDASLAFQAASFQGKKMGRKFLMELQKLVVEGNQVVSSSLFLEIAETISLDIEMFQEDLESEFSKKAFNKDQKLAMDMNVTEAPSCVIYSSKDTRQGYRVESSITKQMLHGLCDDQLEKSGLSYQNLANVFQMV
ncbi:GTP pyrophosphokinase domain protein [Alkalibacterium sp. AK22]|uniref:DsbA family protein n=1 Tax=Alkalibacterium sp. AK22 TaxID=1229520 RepID=UPI000448E1B7|nr:DsbA family protein [Alkalibacterium sp. AK22]EXJ22885.1 GTP pyrophosphokinase domain protein [Alkalibacterium sp. AK22]